MALYFHRQEKLRVCCLLEILLFVMRLDSILDCFWVQRDVLPESSE